MIAPTLTREELRALGIATLTAACTAVATGLVTWVLEEGKAALARRRAKAEPQVSDSDGGTR